MNRKEQIKHGLYNKQKSLFDVMAGRFSKGMEAEKYIDVNVFGTLTADNLADEQVSYIKGFYNMQNARHSVISPSCLRIEKM